MNLSPDLFIPHAPRCRPLLDRLAVLFGQMDGAYDTIAARYGFHCRGCADNCCLTRFHHHTLLEYLYLHEGMRTLPAADRRMVDDAVQTAIEQTAAADRRGIPVRVMCPLNRDGRCRIYAYRPMICRLHGIPYELRRPDGRVSRQPGCDAFFDQCRSGGKRDYLPFDRTPFYRQMALLEQSLRQTTGFGRKIKLTIAEMLATMPQDRHEID